MNLLAYVSIAVVSAIGTSGGLAALAQAVPALNEHTNVPISATVSAAITVFLVGMWVSKKVTMFETNQAAAFRRLDVIDAGNHAMNAQVQNLMMRLDRLERRDERDDR